FERPVARPHLRCSEAEVHRVAKLLHLRTPGIEHIDAVDAGELSPEDAAPEREPRPGQDPAEGGEGELIPVRLFGWREHRLDTPAIETGGDGRDDRWRHRGGNSARVHLLQREGEPAEPRPGPEQR